MPTGAYIIPQGFPFYFAAFIRILLWNADAGSATKKILSRSPRFTLVSKVSGKKTTFGSLLNSLHLQQ
jgi:hypothetical protein